MRNTSLLWCLALTNSPLLGILPHMGRGEVPIRVLSNGSTSMAGGDTIAMYIPAISKLGSHTGGSPARTFIFFNNNFFMQIKIKFFAQFKQFLL